MRKMLFCFFQRLNAAVNRHGQMRKITLQLVNARIVKRRDLAVFFGAQPRKPRFARMDDKHLALAFPGYRFDKITQKRVAVLVINADTGFHRDRDRHDVAHRFNAVGNQLRVPHQAGAKHTVLHAIGRAADVQVNFIIAARLRQLRAVRQRSRIAAAELQGDRMLFFAVGQIVALAVNNRTGGHHFGIQQRVARQLTQKITAVSVGPVEHRRDGKTVSGESSRR